MKKEYQNLVVINGKTYDASSGLIVNTAATHTPKHQSPHQSHRKVMSDVGVHHKPTHAQTTAKEVLAAPKAASHHAQAAPKAPRPDIAARKIHRAPQKTHTLHRAAIQAARKKAEAAKRPSVQLHHPVQAIARHHRAQEAPHVDSVQRFTPNKNSADQPETTNPPQDDVRPSLTLAQLQAKHAPVQAPSKAQIPAHQAKEQLINQRLAEVPVEVPSDNQEQFNEHQHRVNKFFSRQPRMLSAVAGAFCVLLLVGYVTYLNMPAISMRVAASRAGFAATMPSYKPSGYSLHGPVAYSPGQITLNFASNTNTDSFNLTQKESNWDSQALLDNYVSKQTDNYLTYQEKGLTVYMYDGKASWVNGGVWYSVDGKAQLSSDQILKLATSM